MLVADASSAPVGRSAVIRTVIADRTDVEVVDRCRLVAQREQSFCSVMLCETQPFVTEDFVGKGSVTTPLTTVARRLTLCCDRSQKRQLESALAIKAPAIVHAWSVTTKQTV